MRQKLVLNDDVLRSELLYGTVEVNRVPVYDRRRDQAEPGGAEAMVLERTVTDLALAVEEHGAARHQLRGLCAPVKAICDVSFTWTFWELAT
jgi:hypothetical protein